jgi:hypothetical protein
MVGAGVVLEGDAHIISICMMQTRGWPQEGKALRMELERFSCKLPDFHLEPNVSAILAVLY